MRPSSSSSNDPNAPYRNAIASLADCNFFAYEEDALDQSANNESVQNPFAGLIPRRPIQTDRPSASTDAGTSTGSQVTIGTILQYLEEKEIRLHKNIHDTTASRRLHAHDLSPETMLAAIKIAYDTNHPLLATLSANDDERYALISRLSGVVTQAQSFRPGIRQAFSNSNNNPEQLIANVLQYIRGG